MQYKINWSGRSSEYTEDEINAVINVMKNADPLTQGKFLSLFEKDFSEYIDSEYCYGVSNCANALELTADLMRINENDEVIIPAHTYCASAIPFARRNATIKWADIDSDTLLTSLEDIKKHVTDKTKAVILVHLYGKMCDVEAISEYCKLKNIYLVEDCAQSLGAVKNNKHCGTFGDFGTFSFHGQKIISTLGEGGILTVKDPNMAKLVPGLRHNGHAEFKNKTDYWKPAMINLVQDIDGIWPHNFSLTEVQASLGSLLLKRVDDLNNIRRSRAENFIKRLSVFDELVFQNSKTSTEHSYHLLVAKYDGLEYGKSNHDFIKILSDTYKVKAVVQYYPLYKYDLFVKSGYGIADCPKTEVFFNNMISFPFHVWMSDDDFEYMINSTISALKELRG